MSSPLLCVNENSIEWKLLVDSFSGDESAAFAAWKKEGNDFPFWVVAKAAHYKKLENTENAYVQDPHLKRKTEILNKTKVIVAKKAASLARSVANNPHLQGSQNELEQVLKDMNELDAEFALHAFVLAADRMSAQHLNWFNSVKEGKKEVTMEHLKKMQEFVDTFSILESLREEFFRDPAHQKDMEIIQRILKRKTEVKNNFLTIARQKIAEKFTPNFHKVRAAARLTAEREFMKNEKDALIKQGKNKKEVAAAQAEYISQYMIDNAFQIEIDTRQYVQKMLIQVLDISAVESLLVNPKDMNHDLMSMAVESLDYADYQISQATIVKTHAAQKVYDAFTAIVGKSSDGKKQYETILEKDVQGNILPIVINSRSKDWAAFKAKNEGNAIWEMQQFIAKTVDEKDAIVPLTGKLGFILPSMNKDAIERLSANGLLHTVKEGVTDKFKLRTEDTEFGDISGRLEQVNNSDSVEIITNAAGKERENVPLFYRTKMAEKDQSFDVLSTMVLDYNNALNYKAKTETGAYLDVLREVVNESEINKRTSFKRKKRIEKGTDEAVSEGTGAMSNLNKALESLIRHRVYGITVEGDPQVAKLLKGVGSYTSIVSMALNHLSGAANYLHGTTISWIEGFGNKNGLFSAKDRATASAKYHKGMPGVLADVGQRVPKSKTNLLILKFNAFSDFHALDKKFSENNKAKRLGNTGSLLFLNSAGEHAMQSTVMYSILNNIKIQNAEGQFLDKDFKVVENREDAASIDDAMTVNEAGDIVVNSAVAKTDITEGVGEEDMFKISQKIRRTARDLYGNYDQNNKSQLQRHAVGALTVQMRGWLVPGIQKRWRGMGSIGTSYEDMSLDRRSYNQETGEFEEGTYATLTRFIWNLRGDVKALKFGTAFGDGWNNLTDAEKSRLKKAVIELSFATVMFLAASMLRDGADEPEDYYAAFLARRLYSELTTFINPLEGVRTFRSPMIALSTTENAINFVWQGLTDPTEQYQTGSRAGEYKIKRRFTKLVPIWKQYDRSVKEALIFLER